MNLSEVDVVLLCGGLGTRLRPVTDLPKPMVEVGGKPFLEILLDYLSGLGFRRFILSVGYRAETFREYFSSKKFPVEFSEEKEPLGTAGALKLAESKIRGDIFVALNGDSYCELDYAALIDFHIRHKATATLTVIKDPSRPDAGRITLAKDDRIVSFDEKPAEAGSVYLSAGIYVFRRGVLSKIVDGRPQSLEKDLFPLLAGKGLFGYLTDRRLYDIGTPERLESFRISARTASGR